MNRCYLLLLVIGSLAADWPGWRGPTGQGQTEDAKLPIVWGGKENTNVLWKVPLPGVEAGAGQDQNQSSPVVFRDRVYVTASHWSGKPDNTKKPEHRVACYRLSDGKELWNVPVPAGPWQFGDLRGGYTAPTPAVDAERVYVAFGSSVLAALDHTGAIRWRKEIVPHKFDVAFAASPVLFEKTVILQCDQLDRESRILAFDRATGEPKWEQKRPKVGFAHSTPTLATIGGKPQLLVSASNALQGLDPRTGEILWTCDAKGDTVSPVFAGGLVYCDSGRGGPGLAVDPTGMGDVAKTHRKWTIKTVKEGYGSPVASGDFLYRLSNPDVLACIRVSTGEVVYTERLPGVSASASPVATPNGRVYFASAGKSYVVKAGEKLEILSTNDLGDGGPASPAIADGKLILKGRKWLFCVGTDK
ncbi:MAG: PQQ-like beta-propeller repeat protein [Gemmataceae bacterium]|nr:PQQ-like beta-propeller repeat protein [Gemmataceae bacterium]